jgi:hypothetical protein
MRNAVLSQRIKKAHGSIKKPNGVVLEDRVMNVKTIEKGQPMALHKKTRQGSNPRQGIEYSKNINVLKSLRPAS